MVDLEPTKQCQWLWLPQYANSVETWFIEKVASQSAT